MIESVLSELIVAAIFIMLSFLLGVVLVIAPAQRRKRQMFRFFGIQFKNPTFFVYLSVINVVQPFTTASFKPNVVGSYTGPAIPEAELLVVNHVANILQTDPLQNYPRFVREKLASRFDQFKPLQLRLRSSPLQSLPFPGFDFGALLCVGSQTYNSVTDYYMSYHPGYLKLVSSNSGTWIEVLKGEQKGRKFYPTIKQGPGYLGMLERLTDDEHGNTVFVAAGVGTAGTMGAVMYLVHGWKEIAQKYQEKPFALVFELDPRNLTDDKGVEGLKFVQKEWFPGHL